MGNGQCDERRPECIEELSTFKGEMSERLRALEAWQSRQNGTLSKVSDSLVDILQQITALRTHAADVEAEAVRYRKDRENREIAAALTVVKEPAEPSTTPGAVVRLVSRFPFGSGLLIGVVVLWLLIVAKDALVARIAGGHTAPPAATAVP